MNRALLKADAKQAMSQAHPHPALVTLVLLAITYGVSVIIQMIGGGTISASMILSGALLEEEEAALAGMTFGSMILSSVLGLVSVFVSSLLNLGYHGYCLKVFKHEEAGINDLFAYIRFILKAFGLTLFIGLFTFLWSLLCVVPGIIAGLRYSQAFFILAENPEKSIRECVNESKTMMSGHLWEYFVLELSFILWTLLSGITCGIASLYVNPYMTVTYAGYYYSLKPSEATFTA